MTPKAQAILDAQVAFFLDWLEPAGLEPILVAEIEHLLKEAKKLKLGEVVTRQSVKDVARSYASELELSGAIPELVGDIARRLHAHPLQAETPLFTLMADHHFDDWLDKLLELKAVRERLIHEAVSNPVVITLASDLIYRGVRGYLTENALTRGIPGAQSVMKFGKSMLAKATPKLDNAIEQALRNYVERSTRATLAESGSQMSTLLSDQDLREAGREMWTTAKTATVAEVTEGIGDRDVEELFVIGYEHWRSLRKTGWYGAMIDAGIDGFFDKYAKTTLPDLLAELGITPEILLRDAMRFAPQVLAVLKKKKLLEPMIRRQLQPFFESEAVASVLGR